MKYVPIEDITYRSPLSPREITDKIGSILEPREVFVRSSFWGNNEYKPYKGGVAETSFHMKRIIAYKNSFLPRITGTITPEGGGSRVEVKMRLGAVVVLFMCIWFCGIGMVGYRTISANVHSESLYPLLLALLGMVSISYLIALGGFKYESIKSKKFLRELLEAEGV